MWYDGKAIAAGKRMPVEDILHEAGHWLMASVKLRKVINYGLGPDPNGDTPKRLRSPFVGESSTEIQEEIYADGAGILLVALCDGDFRKVLVEHQWETIDEDGIDDLKESARRLSAVGVKVTEKILTLVSDDLTNLLRTPGRPHFGRKPS
jgi:hypothetical protein